MRTCEHDPTARSKSRTHRPENLGQLRTVQVADHKDGDPLCAPRIQHVLARQRREFFQYEGAAVTLRDIK